MTEKGFSKTQDTEGCHGARVRDIFDKLAISGNGYAVKVRIMIFRSSIASSSKKR